MNTHPAKVLSAAATALALLLPALRAQETGAAKGADKKAAEAMLASAEEVAHQVEELRGLKFKKPVPKTVKTKAELADYLAASFRKEYGKGRLERTEAWLHQLGLLPAGTSYTAVMTEVLLSQIGGFYDPDTKSFHMMVEASAYGDAVHRMMVAHELCHALDDQYVDLGAMLHPVGREPTEDEGYVVGGVAEGSATALMFAWMQKAPKKGMLADMSQAAAQQQEQAKVLLAAPLYCSLLAANYIVGQNFLTHGKGLTASLGDRADTGADIAVVAKAMPRSSEQLLHPEKYWDPDKRDEPVLLAGEDAFVKALAAATGRQVVDRNTLGELVCAVVASAPTRKLNLGLMQRADYWSNKPARGWGGDRLFLVAGAPVVAGQAVQDPGVVWLTAWDTVADREEFAAALAQHRGESPGFDVTVAGRTALFCFGSARALDAAARERLLADCTFTQDGRPWAKAP